MGNGPYIYKEGDLSKDELYLRKQLVTFVKGLDHFGGVIPSDETSKKRLKWHVKTRLLMDARTKEEKKAIFGEILVLFPSTIIFVIYNAFKFG